MEGGLWSGESRTGPVVPLPPPMSSRAFLSSVSGDPEGGPLSYPDFHRTLQELWPVFFLLGGPDFLLTGAGGPWGRHLPGCLGDLSPWRWWEATLLWIQRRAQVRASRRRVSTRRTWGSRFPVTPLLKTLLGKRGAQPVFIGTQNSHVERPRNLGSRPYPLGPGV